MSVDCEAYIGFTVNIAEDLSREDFDRFEEFTSAYPEFSQWNHKSDSRVRFIEDGMNGLYARLIYIDKYIEELSMGWSNHYSVLRRVFVPDDVYEELNTAYEKLMHKELDRNNIQYAFWLHFS